MFSTKEERKKAEAAKITIQGRELRIKKATSKYKLEKKEKIRQDKVKEFAGKRKAAESLVEETKTTKEATFQVKSKMNTKDIRKERKAQRQLAKKMKRSNRPNSKASSKKSKVDA
eukprot:TRINITY_DN10781_c0_g1_i11.p3 TRINITY_DN10781_c0_g1~~TRINITY_DN10781_c0_g1_i11.p3  ORF type:complete len:115 (+),score=41.20 TRINITY_DN10781_c0_g1_i11:734-1078(+)